VLKTQLVKAGGVEVLVCGRAAVVAPAPFGFTDLDVDIPYNTEFEFLAFYTLQEYTGYGYNFYLDGYMLVHYNYNTFNAKDVIEFVVDDFAGLSIPVPRCVAKTFAEEFGIVE